MSDSHKHPQKDHKSLHHKAIPPKKTFRKIDLTYGQSHTHTHAPLSKSDPSKISKSMPPHDTPINKHHQNTNTSSQHSAQQNSSSSSTSLAYRLTVAVKTHNTAEMESVAQELQNDGDFISAYKILHKAGSTEKKQRLAKKIASAILYQNGWPDLI